MKVKKTTTSETANSGPTKLWPVLSTQVIQPNRALPMMGSRKNLPKAMIRPEIARITNAAALTQWAARSKYVKRSILRPVSAPWTVSGPLVK